MSLRIAAVATAYHPDDRLTAVVESALESCSTVIVVDNTPGTEPTVADKLAGLGTGADGSGRVKVLRSGANLGLAAALNLGVAELPGDAEAVLLLDQDSALPGEVVTALAGYLDDPTIGIAAPTPWDATHDSSYDNLAALRSEVADRTDVITSGMLIRRGALERVGRFREDFFVDFVDIDFCLRLRRAGVRIVRDKKLALPHSIGDGRDHRLLFVPVRVLHYAAWRHYWVARNGMVLTREHGRALPGFALINALFMARWLAATAVFEPERRTHVRAIVRGLRDGLTGRTDLSYLPRGAEYHGVQAPM